MFQNLRDFLRCLETLNIVTQSAQNLGIKGGCFDWKDLKIIYCSERESEWVRDKQSVDLTTQVDSWNFPNFGRMNGLKWE